MHSKHLSSPKKERENNLRFVLRKLMHDANLSEIQLARTLKMPVTTLNQLLNSETVSPRVETLLPIARYFNIHIEQLIGVEPIESNKLLKKKNIINDKRQHEWKPEVYVKCIELACNTFNQKKYALSAEQALEITKEIYFYALHRGTNEVDSAFVEWFVAHTLNT